MPCTISPAFLAVAFAIPDAIRPGLIVTRRGDRYCVALRAYCVFTMCMCKLDESLRTPTTCGPQSFLT